MQNSGQSWILLKVYLYICRPQFSLGTREHCHCHCFHIGWWFCEKYYVYSSLSEIFRICWNFSEVSFTTSPCLNSTCCTSCSESLLEPSCWTKHCLVHWAISYYSNSCMLLKETICLKRQSILESIYSWHIWDYAYLSFLLVISNMSRGSVTFENLFTTEI